MRAAIVAAAGRPPLLREFPAPVARPGETLIRVTAAAVSHLVKGRASGAHYSAGGEFPAVVGLDGVGRTEDGARVYFAMARAPHGSMAEFTVADARLCVPLPDGLDDRVAAAIANPGMSSWAALAERARLRRGETVLVNGATGTAGRLAVRIAKRLGAGRVIATGRDASALADVAALGADATILLGDDMAALEGRFMDAFAEGIDIVVDYLWGPSAERLLIAAAKGGRDGVPMRFVQVGSVAAPEITLPGAALRASAIELTGVGKGSIPLPRLIATIGEVLRATVPAGLEIAFRPVPLADFDWAWPEDESTCRTVFTIDGEGR